MREGLKGRSGGIGATAGSSHPAGLMVTVKATSQLCLLSPYYALALHRELHLCPPRGPGDAGAAAICISQTGPWAQRDPAAFLRSPRPEPAELGEGPGAPTYCYPECAPGGASPSTALGPPMLDAKGLGTEDPSGLGRVSPAGCGFRRGQGTPWGAGCCP